ncbi:hypothetical protein J6500_02145 [Bradyrhizobium sp. WSM 1704]|uniref:hypothetical protein n=1 Tax=Bradyrhizobium semiaridum TaxID=2821404 RepID=UPI001CE35FE9|nr:hypothetical protein [Bradyrhizobium semiaridum]MCA6120708.1 hypothetical protein [Bradyrhizobium semiaridum]
MELKRLVAAAALTAAVATPAFAQDPAARSAPVQHPRTQIYHQHYNSGFWPGDVAAGVVGGAIGTAGAIATAPFRNDYGYDRYAYNDGYYRQGFVCQPGTVFRGADGQRHLCQ